MSLSITSSEQDETTSIFGNGYRGSKKNIKKRKETSDLNVKLVVLLEINSYN